jgi:hypothetical protein
MSCDRRLNLLLLKERLSVCRLAPAEAVPPWAGSGALTSVTRTDEELSVVCAEGAAPEGTDCESGWRALKIEGPLDFGLTGVLASVAGPLAEAGVSIFAISTFNTDYMLVKEERLEKAVAALAAAGHRVGRE